MWHTGLVILTLLRPDKPYFAGISAMIALFKGVPAGAYAVLKKHVTLERIGIALGIVWVIIVYILIGWAIYNWWHNILNVFLFFVSPVVLAPTIGLLLALGLYFLRTCHARRIRVS